MRGYPLETANNYNNVNMGTATPERRHVVHTYYKMIEETDDIVSSDIHYMYMTPYQCKTCLSTNNHAEMLSVEVRISKPI